jgi:signal transduction histidine kinase
MRAFVFLGRWGWLVVVAVTLLISAHFLETVAKYEDSAHLADDVRGLREFQERMLQAGVSEWLLGETTSEPPAQIADEADEYVAAAIEDHGLRVNGFPRDDDFARGMITSMTGAARELRKLSALSEEPPNAEEIAELGAFFGVSEGSQRSSVFAELTSDPEQLSVLYGALSYTVASERITRQLDRATGLATEESNAHFSALRRAGEIGIGFLLVGGVLGAVGYAWAGHRVRRARWEIERASERAELGSEFVSLASHELRTPLVGIYGFSELLLEEEGLAPHRRDWVERIHKESARLTRIVEDLLDVSRIESGRMEVRREVVEFGEVLDSVFATFEGVSPIHHLRIRGDLDARVMGDQDKLIEVLSNLVDNAIKYSVDGGLVVIDAQIGGERLEVRVIDEGVGIPVALQEAIFERFGRARLSATEHVRSTGLGLYLVQEMLRLMESTISVESNEGDGATFTFSLPLATEGSVEASDDAMAA